MEEAKRRDLDEDPSCKTLASQQVSKKDQQCNARTNFINNDPPQQQEPDSDEDDEDVESDESEHHEDDDLPISGGTAWPKPRALMDAPYEEPVAIRSSSPAAQSSSSSFRRDDNTSESAEHDTDRSTSPESTREKHVFITAQRLPDTSEQHSAKLASQLAAARYRQHSDLAMQQPEESQIHQTNVQRPYAQSSVSSLRQRPVPQQPPPPIENLPLTGYELLATKLSSTEFDADGPRIKPMYRKFELLQHRLLLHLQDELSELEDQLEQIDDADTQSRMFDRHVVPASRRTALTTGGGSEYQTEILGRIGFKLNLYNKALSSFNSIQSLSSPRQAEIEDYRNWLHGEQAITESETQFLNVEEDLVSVARRQDKRIRRHLRRADSSESSTMVPSIVSSRTSTIHTRSTTHPRSAILPVPTAETNIAKEAVPRISLPVLACAISFTFLLPILSFLVIPGLLGRVIVTILVAFGALGGLLHTEIVSSNVLLSQEGATCIALYGGIMLVIAAIVA